MKKLNLFKKLFILLASSSALVSSFVSVSSLTKQKEITNVSAKDDSEYGKWVIYAYSVLCGGTSTVQTTGDSYRTFKYNSTSNFYELTYVFYEGDQFLPYVNGNGFVQYHPSVTQEAKDYFGSVNLSYFNLGGNHYFKVNKTGKYTIKISKDIEDLNTSNFYTIWNDRAKSSIEYEDTIDFVEPRGDYKIYLYGAFAGTGWDATKVSERLFTYNAQTRNYELTLGLSKGDSFVPYITSPSIAYINYYPLNGGDSLLETNNVSDTHNTSNYFTALKNGTYKISISYEIEYFIPSLRGFSFSEEGRSRITYLSEKQPAFNFEGSEDIVLTGTIDSKNVVQTSSVYHLSVDMNAKLYKGVFSFKQGDFFTLYMKTKKQAYINYLQNNSYADQIFAGANLTAYASAGRQHFFVNNPGKYEIVIGGNVENLSTPTDTWKNLQGSYIRYLGENVKETYVLLGDKSDSQNVVYTEKEGATIKQFGIEGLEVYTVQGINVSGHGKIIKIDYDEQYSDKFTLTNSFGGVDTVITRNLVDSGAYTLDSEETNSSLGKVSKFLILVKDKYESLDKDTAKDIETKYDALTNEEKEIVNASTFMFNGSNENVTFASLLPNIRETAKGPNVVLIAIGLLLGGILLIAIVGYFLLAMKKKNDDPMLVIDSLEIVNQQYIENSDCNSNSKDNISI